MREIIYNEKPLPIHFGLRGLHAFAKRKGIPFNAVLSGITTEDFDFITGITVEALNEGARKSASEKRYTDDDIWDMFEDDPKLIVSVTEIFVESITPLVDKLKTLAVKK